MTRNILADVMIGLGIVVLVLGMLFIFNIWPVAGESNQQVKQTENNIAQNQTEEKTNKEEDNEFNIKKEYIVEEEKTDFNTEFAWERNLSSSNNIDFENKIAEEEKEREEVEIVIPAGSSASVIANKLSENGIMDREKFINALIIFDAEKKLNSGTYVLKKDSDILEVFSKILVGGGDYND
ncbi:MAG: hypothetical protein ACQEQD_02245 [Bacillota bacterium]